jgi:hypothetical protein
MRSKCRDEALFDAEGGQLAELVEQSGALGHELIHERERMLRLLAEQRAKTDRAEKQRFAFFVGLGVGSVTGILGEPLGTEGFSRRSDPWHEAASRAYAAAQHDPSARHDEDPVGHRATLIDRESGRPGRTRSVRHQCLALGFSQPRESQTHLRHRHPHIADLRREFAMSGPDLTCDARHHPLQRLIGDDAGGPARGTGCRVPVFLQQPARS